MTRELHRRKDLLWAFGSWDLRPSASQEQSMAGGRHGRWSWKQRAESSHLRPQGKQREQTENGQTLLRPPPPVMHFLHKATSPRAPLTVPPTEDQAFKCQRLWGTSIVQATTIISWTSELWWWTMSKVIKINCRIKAH